jgi:tetratricopeptide (TPR) repeat protein
MTSTAGQIRKVTDTIVGLIFGACLAACATLPQSRNDMPDHTNHDMGVTTNAFLGPIDLIPQALGPYQWNITTASAEAQAYFNQGMQLRWAFNVDEAARSFAMARQIDPRCAMCYWGEAFALGSYLNGGMTAEKAPYAHAAITKAAELSAANASPMEKDLIDAAIVRYPKDYDPDNRRSVDEAFAHTMAMVYERYPRNHEVATVYAVALFMLEDRRGYRDIDDPDLIRLHGVLAKVLDEDIRHPGACHLYIHATESSQRPDLALECAEFLGSAIPVASHIQHMPSHTWNQIGLWGKSVRANTIAWQSDQKALHKEGFSSGPTHNLHMLLFAASFDGQGAVATQAGKDYRKLTGNSMYEVLTLLRFGRFDEVLENSNRPADDVAAALWDFAYGYASLREGDLETATALRDKTLRFAATTKSKFRFHPAQRIVGTAAHILEGEIFRQQGELDNAIAALASAVAVEDEIGYDEPEPLPFAARHWLGAALLEAGRFAEAEQAYRQDLEDHPHNGWSLVGLKAALSAQEINHTEIDLDLEESWSRADTWITASRF